MEKMQPERGVAHEQWIAEQTLDALYGNALTSLVGSLAVVLVLGATLWTQIDSISLVYWAGSGILIAVARFLLWFGHKNKKKNLPRSFWLNSYRLTSLFSGILNGVAMWLFFDTIPAAYQLLIFFSIVGLTAAASGTHAVDLPTFHLFMLPSCLLAVIKLMSYGETTNFALSIMFVFYILVMERIGRQNNITLLHNFKLTHTMHYRATHDSLVDLINRTEFENQFEMNSPLTRHGVAILFLDLDNFKPLNDTLGHQAGDRALKQVANIMVESLRADDAVARLGGDEFVASLFLDDINEVKKIADTILQKINEISFTDHHNYTGLSASIGISFHHNSKIKYSQLLQAADSACYQSKEQGKNQVTVAFVENDV